MSARDETLPALLARRHGIAPAVPVAVAIALLLAIALVALLTGSKTAGLEQVVHRSAPVYNLLHAPGKVREVPAHPGELTRLEAAAGGYRATLTISKLRLPPYRGNVSGVLPIYATAAVDPGELLDESKARVNDAPGYQVGLRTGPATTLRKVYVLPADSGVRDGVVIAFEQTGKGPRDVVMAAKKAFRSFRFGTGRG